jgi:uncharacterized membrane protein
MLTMLRWVHLLAASLWLGGLVFIIVVMRAPVQALGTQVPLDAMFVRFRRRYKSLLIGTVAALAISGIAALAVRHAKVSTWYVVLLIFKILLSAGVIALFWYVAFVREGPRRVSAPSFVEAPDAARPPADAGQTKEDVDFFFRPPKHQALVQWAIVVATALVILLGLITAHLGEQLAERGRQEQHPPAAATP